MHACMHTESLQSCLTLQVPLSMGFCRQDYWSGLPYCPPGDLSNPGIKPLSLMSPALAGRIFFYHWHQLGSLSNTGVGYHALLQGIEPSFLSFLHWQAGSLSQRAIIAIFSQTLTKNRNRGNIIPNSFYDTHNLVTKSD